MTLPIERARTRRPITWLTIVGVLLLPVLIGGILVAALYNPAERLDEMSAAIVNDDEAVEIDGQTVPLGRQLTAGLVEGSDEIASNLDWTISNADDAAEGLADGTYQAVVTIPENFSVAATSTAPGGSPEQALIEVSTPPDSKVVDDAITAQVTSAAASILGTQLSQVYLENVFLGFTSLGDQLGDAASGAQQLADGATQAADGATALADGAGELSTGASGLGSGANELGSGLDQLADGTREAASGATQLASGVYGGADALEANGLVPDELYGAVDGALTTANTSAGAATAVSGQLKALVAKCDATMSPEFCGELQQAAGTAAGSEQAAAGTAAYVEGVSSGLTQFDQGATAEFAGRFRTIAGSVAALSGGLGQLASGADQSADGARRLGDGAAQLAGGIGEAGAGATTLAGGITELATGTSTLADGLDQASTAVPSYSENEATSLASVVADPVATDGVGSSLFGASAVPLLATLALWFGGLGTFVALQAASRRALTSRAPSAALALRGLAPAAALGAVQGLLVAGVVQLAAGYDGGAWSLFALMCVVAGVAFAAVNQALVAVFGGAGRWLAALVGVLAVATGVVSTVPGVLADAAALLPTAPAYNGMLAALTETDGLGAAIAGLLIWSGLAFTATTLAVARKRVARPAELLAASPVPA
ncbi:MAG TPA: YhgE/Pip family protein [Microbacterium sp.]|nr:YhgE/Pip family protein [Microbacterium sp.]